LKLLSLKEKEVLFFFFTYNVYFQRKGDTTHLAAEIAFLERLYLHRRRYYKKIGGENLMII
jgi:hypothetical protein